MIVQALDGRYVTVRRRWVPWRLKARKFDGFDAFDIVGGADDPVSFVALLALAIFLALFGGIILTVAVLAGEFFLLLLLLLPLLAAARMLYLLPWKIEATYGDQTLGTVGVRGWRESEERIRDIAGAYQRGEDPFPVSA
ncbi:hypothetical protein ABIE44_003545 [Marmoricola sp. OAE513]|uniref:hypothetical protein n=1 Tax=Marmoricola sp. OAE513 TaxID=2817894 RepID=UPI001AE36662